MAVKKIYADAAFQVLSHSFSVSPSQNSYILQYSASGREGEWTDYEEEVPADETLIVNGCAFGQYIRLDGYTPYDDEGSLVF